MFAQKVVKPVWRRVKRLFRKRLAGRGVPPGLEPGSQIVLCAGKRSTVLEVSVDSAGSVLVRADGLERVLVLDEIRSYTPAPTAYSSAVRMAGQLSKARRALESSDARLRDTAEELERQRAAAEEMRHYKDNVEKMVDACDAMERERESRDAAHRRDVEEMSDEHRLSMARARKAFAEKLDSVGSQYHERMEEMSRRHAAAVKRLEGEVSRLSSRAAALEEERGRLRSEAASSQADTQRLLELQKERLLAGSAGLPDAF